MTQSEIAEFRLILSQLDASYDEWKMLISFMVNEASEEFAHRKIMEEI